MTKKIKRREFIKLAAATAPLLTVPFFLEGCATNPFRNVASSDPKSPNPAPGMGTRVSAHSPDAIPHLKSYAKAIAKMRTLPDTNGCSWYQQAQIHNNHCWHNSWFFYPWHRDYLHRFEAIIRDQSGDPNFMLPYWDWTTNPDLPPQFLNVKDKDFGQLACSSKSWDKTADPSRAQADQLKAQVAQVASPQVMAQIMAAADFPTFMGGDGAAGGVEGGPHNGVHGIIGSYGGPMGDYTSPLDPIFWLHHCNVDRVWACWQKLNPQWTDQSKILPVQDGQKTGQDWLAQKLQGFFDLQGNAVPDDSANTPVAMLSTMANGLTYSYHDMTVLTASPTAQRQTANRHLAQENATPAHVVAFTERSIVGKSTWDKDATGAVIGLNPPRPKSNTEKFVNDYLSGAASGNFFRLKVAELPRVLVDEATSAGAGPFMKITLKTGAQSFDLGYFNFFVPMHPGHKHAAPAAHFDFGQALDALKGAKIEKYPDDLAIRVDFENPRTGEKFAVDPHAFANVDIKIIVVG